MKKILISLLLVSLILVGCGKKNSNEVVSYTAKEISDSKNIIDFADGESFEATLNSGDEKQEGKIVKFIVNKYAPDSALGFNAWSGEHLNFISKDNLTLDVGDTVIAKVTKVGKKMGSWVINYEPLEDGTVNENTISINGSTNTADDSIFDSALTVFNEGDYKFIKGDDLQTYASNLSGESVYTVTTVSEVKDNMVQCTLGDGFMMSSFNTSVDYTSLLNKDDTVAILGEVADTTSYSFMGTSVSLDNCLVFAVGDKAQEYAKDSSDEALSGYLVVTEEVANNMGSSKVGEDDYKALCETVSHEDVLRNPDTYKNKYVKVSGRVDQVIEGLFKVYTFYVVDSNGDKWECTYSYNDGESHILEGDRVTFYGKCKGTTTSTTVLGKQVTMPYISLQYIQ